MSVASASRTLDAEHREPALNVAENVVGTGHCFGAYNTGVNVIGLVLKKH